MKKQQLTTQDLSQERTLLAAKRTFSAWIRTGLSGVAGGLAVLRVIRFKSSFHELIAHIIGHLLIVWGTTIFLFAAADYHKTYQKLFPNHRYRFSWWILAMTMPLVIISFLVLWLVG